MARIPTAADLAIRRAYGRGYNAAFGRRWPDHKPPIPPDAVMGNIVRTVSELREALDGELAKFSEDDELVELLGPKMDAVTEALQGLSHWLKEADPTT